MNAFNQLQAMCE